MWKEITTTSMYFESSGETNEKSIDKEIIDDIIYGYNNGWVIFVPKNYGSPETLYINGEDQPDIYPVEYSENIHTILNNVLPIGGYYMRVPMTPNALSEDNLSKIRNLYPEKKTIWNRFESRMLNIKNPLTK